MFAGTLTRNVETAAAQYTGMIHSTRFDIAIQLEARAKMSERSPDFDVTAVNKSGRKVRIGTAWNETGNTSGNPYISMQIDVGLGPFRVNAVQTKEARATQSGEFEIIPLVSNGLMKSGSISGELTAMDADNAFTGYIANMMFDRKHPAWAARGQRARSQSISMSSRRFSIPKGEKAMTLSSLGP